MFKKGMSFVLAAAFSLMLTSATFASIQLNPVEEGGITLIEPQIGSERQVFVKDSMAISIRAEGDQPVDVSLYKVMPSERNDDLDGACDSKMITDAEDVPFRVISGSSIVAKDADSDDDDSDEADERDLLDDIVLEDDDSAEPDKIIDGSEALLQKERLSTKDRQKVIKAFNKAKDDLEDQIDDLEDIYDEYTDAFPNGHDDILDYSDKELKLIKSYLISVEETQESCQAFVDARESYEAIFEIPLFGPEDLTDTGILPYYQKTVEKITPGLYKFVFSEQETSEIVDIIEFEVIKKEKLTEEDIKEAMPMTIGDLILPSVDLTDDEEDIQVDDVQEITPVETEADEVEVDETEIDETEAEPEMDSEMEENEIETTDQLETPADDNTEE